MDNAHAHLYYSLGKKIMWKDISDWWHLRSLVNFEADQIRKNIIDLGRKQYSLSLLHGVLQAIMSNYESIVAVELGVAQGSGLIELSKAAQYFSDKSGISIEVYGFDSTVGLPDNTGAVDHPEIWHKGLFQMGSPSTLKNQLPICAHLIEGDVKETILQFEEKIENKRIAFVSIDLDYYSSTINAMPIFEFNADKYVPAVPVYIDDAYDLITYNPWCGEEKAINEFNERNALRKIHRKPNFDIDRFHICQILDHPIRNNILKPKFPFEIGLGLI